MATTDTTAAQQATNPTAPTCVNWGTDEARFVLGFVSNAIMDFSREGITLDGNDCVGLGLILKSCESALKEAA